MGHALLKKILQISLLKKEEKNYITPRIWLLLFVMLDVKKRAAGKNIGKRGLKNKFVLIVDKACQRGISTN